VILVWAKGAGTLAYPDDKERLIGQINVNLNQSNMSETPNEII
jgi:hypothetical protein